MTTPEQQQIAELRAEVAALREAVTALTTAAPDRTPNGPGVPGVPVVPSAPRMPGGAPADRRTFLRGGAIAAGALAAGTAASITGAAPAAAADAPTADNDNLVLGTLNEAASQTSLVIAGGETPPPFGFAVSDANPSTDVPTPAILGEASGNPFIAGVVGLATGTDNAGLLGSINGAGWGVLGRALDATGIGVQGEGILGIGVMGVTATGTAVVGHSDSGTAIDARGGAGIGVKAAGGRAALLLGGPLSSPTDELAPHTAGEVWAQVQPDNDVASIWICVTGGTPGTWRKIAGFGTAGSLHLLANPSRIYDSRPGNPPAEGQKTPLTGSNSPRSIDATLAAPPGATAVVVNLTVVNTSSSGFVALHRGGSTWPGNSSINWTAAGTVIANGTLVALGTNRHLAATCAPGASTDLIIDVIGYYL